MVEFLSSDILIFDRLSIELVTLDVGYNVMFIINNIEVVILNRLFNLLEVVFWITLVEFRGIF